MKLQHENLKNEKKEAVHTGFDELKTKSVLFFQIGLIIALLAAYVLLEMQFKVKQPIAYAGAIIEEPPTYVLPNFTVAPPKTLKKVIKKAKPKSKYPEKIEVVKNDIVIKKTIEDNIFTDKGTPTKTSGIDENKLNVELPDDVPPVNVMSVEEVPVFPGCENQTNRAGKLKCMSKKLSKFIKGQFNADLAADLGLSGKQRIAVQFKIDEKGSVITLKARAPHNKLEEEAKRVINKLPKMTPGKQGHKNVAVVYALPIVFNVQ